MKKVYYSWSEINGAVVELARSIMTSDWRPDYIVGITRGGAVPAVMLSQFMGIPMHPLEVSLRDGGNCTSDLGTAEDAFDGKKILVVDDINDQGSTINWIKADWPGGCHPHNEVWNNVFHNNVRFAVLTNNLASNADIDYYCWEVNKAEEDCWLVYPWEEFWK